VISYHRKQVATLTATDAQSSISLQALSAGLASYNITLSTSQTFTDKAGISFEGMLNILKASGKGWFGKRWGIWRC
jgi:hypothetical protein